MLRIFKTTIWDNKAEEIENILPRREDLVET